MLLAFALGITNVESQAAQDLTRVPEAQGAAVVEASVAQITGSGIFPADNNFLRRIACVESRDGTHPNTYRNGYYGGIWQVRALFVMKKIFAFFSEAFPEMVLRWCTLRKKWGGGEGCYSLENLSSLTHGKLHCGHIFYFYLLPLFFSRFLSDAFFGCV